MRREKLKRNRIIVGLIGVLLLMTVGYAAFQSQLDIKTTSTINSKWDVRIEKIEATNKK